MEDDGQVNFVVPPVVTPTGGVACPKTDCSKVYKARGTMMAHMRKHHKEPTEINSPLGSFPPSNSAITLQFDETEAAIQGNSDGAVNSPKVVTGGTFICAACDLHFSTKEEVTKHIEETHITFSQQLQNNDDVLEEAAKEQDLNDLYDQFETLFKVWKVSEKGQELPAELVEKLERFKAILKKKDDINKETKIKLDDEVNAAQLVKEENKKLVEECNPQGEVVTRQTARLVERDNEVDKLKGDLSSAKKIYVKHTKERME